MITLSIPELTVLISLAVLIFGIYQWLITRKDKFPNIRRTIRFGIYGLGVQNRAVLILDVSNAGGVPVRIVSVELVFKRDVLAFVGGIEGTETIPFDLPPLVGSARFYAPVSTVQQELRRNGYKNKLNIRVRFRDSNENRYDSRQFSFNINAKYD